MKKSHHNSCKELSQRTINKIKKNKDSNNSNSLIALECIEYLQSLKTGGGGQNSSSIADIV